VSETESLRQEIHGLRGDIARLVDQLNDYTTSHGQQIAVLSEWKTHVDSKITTLFDLQNAHTDLHRRIEEQISELRQLIIQLQDTRESCNRRLSLLEDAVSILRKAQEDTEDKLDALINQGKGIRLVLYFFIGFVTVAGTIATIYSVVH